MEADFQCLSYFDPSGKNLRKMLIYYSVTAILGYFIYILSYLRTKQRMWYQVKH